MIIQPLKLKKLKNKKKNKKASILDIFIFVIFSFIVTIIFILIVFFFYKMNQGLTQISDPSVSAIVNQTSVPIYNQVETNMKWMTYFFIFAMMFSILIHNFLIKIHPAYIIIYIIFSLAAVVVAVGFSNAYENILKANNEVSDFFKTFDVTSFILLHLPIFAIVIGIIGLIFLFIGIGNRNLNNNSDGLSGGLV